MQKSGGQYSQGDGTISRYSKVEMSLATHTSANFLISLLLCVLFVCSYPCVTFQLNAPVKRSQFCITPCKSSVSIKPNA